MYPEIAKFQFGLKRFLQLRLRWGQEYDCITEGVIELHLSVANNLRYTRYLDCIDIDKVLY
jgi:hypothetical protein